MFLKFFENTKQNKKPLFSCTIPILQHIPYGKVKKKGGGAFKFNHSIKGKMELAFSDRIYVSAPDRSI